MSKTLESDADLRLLFPGRTVKLQHNETEYEVTVFPIGVGHIRKFTEAIQQIMPKILAGVDLSRVNDKSYMSTMVVPIVIQDLLDLVNECTSGPNITDNSFPHFWLPPIIEAWWEESFGDELGKLMPWLEAANRLLSDLTGKEVDLTQVLSPDALDPDSPGTMSSTEDNLVPLTTG